MQAAALRSLGAIAALTEALCIKHADIFARFLEPCGSDSAAFIPLQLEAIAAAEYLVLTFSDVCEQLADLVGNLMLSAGAKPS